MSFLCDECGAQFSVGEKLKVHMFQNHGTTLYTEDNKHKYFQCEHCNKSIKGGLNLERHVRKYHKIKIHKCTQCNYKTNRAYNLIEHKLTHTGQAKGTQISQRSSSSSETEDKQASIIHKKKQHQETFQCEQCNKTLNCKKSLLRHVENNMRHKDLVVHIATIKQIGNIS